MKQTPYYPSSPPSPPTPFPPSPLHPTPNYKPHLTPRRTHTDSYNYRSATLFGHAHLVTSPPEKLYALELITNSIVPHRWANTRVPPNAAEMQSTSVLKVSISTGSAKIRTGGPHDERGDMEDEEVLGRVWTGVVPVHSVLGAPVAGGYNRVGEVPGYLEGWRGEVNRGAEGYAREAVGREVGGEKLGG